MKDSSQDDTMWEARVTSLSHMLEVYPASMSFLLSLFFALFIFWEVRSKRKNKFSIFVFSVIVLFSFINGVKNI